MLGKYKTPRFRFGRVVLCEVRGEVEITGMTDSPIPWPLGLRGRGRHSLIAYKDLAKALRRESNQAVANWWGITPQTVSKWRKLLNITRATPGTHRLFSNHASDHPAVIEGRRQAVAKAGDPERREKIAAARRGKPRPPHVLEAMHAARRGSHHTQEKMRQAHQERRKARETE